MWKLRMLAALAALLVLGVVVADGASAQGATVRVGRVTVGAGLGKVELQAQDLGGLGLGAWEVNVTYNPAVVTVVDCDAVAPGGICNENYAPNIIRSVGATAAGMTGERVLASMTFRCDQIATSDLTISIDVFVDAHADAPQPIATKIMNGSITCNAISGGSGDVDCDGRVTAIDAALVLQYGAALINTLPCIEEADLNGDGRINSIDAFLILVIVAGL
jgi:hypothetical protein